MAVKKALFKFFDDITDTYRLIDMDLDENTTEDQIVEIFQRLKTPIGTGGGGSTLSGHIVKTIKASGGDFANITDAVNWVNSNSFTEGATVDFNIENNFVIPDTDFIYLGDTDFSFVSFNALGTVTAAVSTICFYKATRSPKLTGTWNLTVWLALVNNVDTTRYGPWNNPDAMPPIAPTNISTLLVLIADNVATRDSKVVQMQFVKNATITDALSINSTSLGDLRVFFTKNPIDNDESFTSPYISGSNINAVNIAVQNSGVNNLEFNTVISGLNGSLAMNLNSWIKIGTSDIFISESTNSSVISTPPKNFPENYISGPVITNNYIKAASVGTITNKLLTDVFGLGVINGHFARDLSNLAKAANSYSITTNHLLTQFANNVKIFTSSSSIELDVLHDYESLRVTNDGNDPVTVTLKKRGVTPSTPSILIQAHQWVDLNNNLIEIDRLPITATTSVNFAELPVGFPNVELPSILTNGVLSEERNYINYILPNVENTFFLDAINGSDSNNGLTPTTPFQTLAALDTITLSGNEVARYYLSGTFDINGYTPAAVNFPGTPILSGWKDGGNLVGYEVINSFPTDNLDGSYTYTITSMKVDMLRSTDSYKEYTLEIDSGALTVPGTYKLDGFDLTVFPFVGDSAANGSFIINTTATSGNDIFYLDGRDLLTISANMPIVLGYKTIFANNVISTYPNDSSLVPIIKCRLDSAINNIGKMLIIQSETGVAYAKINNGTFKTVIINSGLLIMAGNTYTLSGSGTDKLICNKYIGVPDYDGTASLYMLAESYNGANADSLIYSEGNIYTQNSTLTQVANYTIEMQTGNNSINFYTDGSNSLSLPINGNTLAFF